MKKVSKLFVVLLLLFTACKKDLTIPDGVDPAVNLRANANVVAAKEKLVAFIRSTDLVNRVHNYDKRNANPSGQANARAAGLPHTTDMEDYASFIKTAIDPDTYECGPTILDPYIQAKISSWDDNDFLIFGAFSGLVFDYAYVYQNSNASGTPYFGDHGQYNNVSTRTFRDLKSFWNIPNDIYLTDSHGAFFNDVAKVGTVLRLYRELGILDPSVTDAEIIDLANYLKIVFGSAHFQNFLNPLLTFNAFAAPADPYFNTPKKIVMGDGIQQSYYDLGYGDVATQAIMAHEFGHQVQFANPALVTFDYSPEGTRLTELMADAFAGYYLTHSRGASMNWRRVQQFLVVFYAIGDCQFTSASHHGTPNQRLKAATFGNQVANNASNQGHILTSQQFISLFYNAYPGMIAPDH